MPRKSHLTTKDDVELLRWWREWLHALDAEMAAVDQRDEESWQAANERARDLGWVRSCDELHEAVKRAGSAA